jgi:hypothetical protein
MLYGVIGGYSKDRDIYSSKTLVTAWETTWFHNPEDHDQHGNHL